MDPRSPPPPHDSALGHVTGAAPYVEDLPYLEGELVVDFVPSPCACGVLEIIDVEEALAIEGVVGIYTSADVPGKQHFGTVFEDEPFLPAQRIDYLGQPLAVIAAESRKAALEARQAVRVVVREETPVLSLEEAESKGLYIGPERKIESGNLERGWRQAAHRLEGTFSSNGQEHFYLESQAALAWPGERDDIQVHSSTQNPTEIQRVLAEVLDRRQHQIVCLVKRMGGAFGGKETQAALPALMAALTVDRTGRPARVVYSKDDDMKSTGKRHPYLTEYRVGFDDDGRIVAAEFRMRSNGGAFADLSTSILERSMLHADNAYYLPNVSIEARVCRTNLPPNTAFRGFGGPQAMAVIENVMQEIAIRLGRDALDIRLANAYPANLSAATETPPEGRFTPYGQEVIDNLLPEILSRLEKSSEYRTRIAAASSLNAEAPTHLRGIALTPVKFGISFTTKFLNQANALVNVYTDGTVQVSTGATEMGQGVNTKIAQLVAAELGIAVEDVAVTITSTEKNNNTSPTAASAGTDLNGTAAVRAAAAIRTRLSDFAARLFAEHSPELEPSPADVRFESGEVYDPRRPDERIPFAELCDRARRERVDLGARGFYATPGVDFDRDAGRGEPFYYFTTGACVAEVLIDRLTGALRIERLDALLDLGRVLNLGIERGQAIGGLIQGIGWVTAEELVYGDGGELLSSSPTTYKIPGITDLPCVLNLDFLDNDLNRRNVGSGKAVGEPPLMLALSVWAAVKHALSFVAPGEIPDLRLPATHEEILLCISRMESLRR